MSNGLEIRDPIHGFIFRETEERDIVDTAVFQRLRRLRQLALANLVYPGATHTRFDHSLGAFHVAGKIIEKLTGDNSLRQVVRYATLLHDVGHGPFSHVAEPILKKYSPKEKLPSDEHKIHEMIGQQIILTNPEISKIIGQKTAKKMVGLLNGTWEFSYLHDIVSGPMDADKQDYLLRDSHFSGVKYGVFDLDRLHNTLIVHEDAEEDDKYLAISIDGIHALEQFVLAKYYMTTQVYRHRIRLITDQMIERGIMLGIEHDKIPWLKPLFAFDGTQEYLDEYLTWNDDRLINSIVDKNTVNGYSKRIFQCLQNRKLFKCIFDADQNDFPNSESRSFIFDGPKDFFPEIEKRIATTFSLDPNLVIAYRISFDSATKTESNVSVIHKTKKPTLFREESALFKSADEKIRDQRFLIFSPLAENDDEKAKKKLLREYKEGIVDIVDNMSNKQNKLPLPAEGAK